MAFGILPVFEEKKIVINRKFANYVIFIFCEFFKNVKQKSGKAVHYL